MIGDNAPTFGRINNYLTGLEVPCSVVSCISLNSHRLSPGVAANSISSTALTHQFSPSLSEPVVNRCIRRNPTWLTYSSRIDTFIPLDSTTPSRFSLFWASGLELQMSPTVNCVGWLMWSRCPPILVFIEILSSLEFPLITDANSRIRQAPQLTVFALMTTELQWKPD